MRIRCIPLFAVFMMLTAMAVGQNSNRNIDAYLSKNPRTVRMRCLQEGCNISMSASDSDVFVQVFVSHPAMQMRLLMQEWTLFIDPTGRKKEKYALVSPGGQNVRRQMGNMPQAPSSPRGQGAAARPDHSKLLATLNMHGATWDVDGKVEHLDASRFAVAVDDEHEAIVYSMLVPKKEMMKEKKRAEKWNIGIYVAANSVARPAQGGGPGRGPGRGPGGGPGQPGMTPGPGRQPAQGRGDDGQQELMTKELEEWVTVSYSKLMQTSAKKDVSTPQHKPTAASEPLSCHSSKEGVHIDMSIIRDTIDLTVKVEDGENQMVFVMQGFEVSFGEKGKECHIVFPSAKDSRDSLSHHPDQIGVPSPEGVQPPRPDMGYVLNAFSPAMVHVEGGLAVSGFSAEIDTAAVMLIYRLRFLAKKPFIKEYLNRLTITTDIVGGEERPAEFEMENDGDVPRDAGEHRQRGKKMEMVFQMDCYDGE